MSDEQPKKRAKTKGISGSTSENNGSKGKGVVPFYMADNVFHEALQRHGEGWNKRMVFEHCEKLFDLKCTASTFDRSFAYRLQERVEVIRAECSEDIKKSFNLEIDVFQRQLLLLDKAIIRAYEADDMKTYRLLLEPLAKLLASSARNAAATIIDKRPAVLIEDEHRSAILKKLDEIAAKTSN